jgi:hypothetical protein
MLDWLIKGGTVVDGTGCAPYVADVGVRDGRIVEVGAITTLARQTLQAHSGEQPVIIGFPDGTRMKVAPHFWVDRNRLPVLKADLALRLGNQVTLV